MGRNIGKCTVYGTEKSVFYGKCRIIKFLTIFKNKIIVIIIYVYGVKSQEFDRKIQIFDD